MINVYSELIDHILCEGANRISVCKKYLFDSVRSSMCHNVCLSVCYKVLLLRLSLRSFSALSLSFYERQRLEYFVLLILDGISSCECDNIRDVHNLVRFLMTGAHEVETSGQTLRQSDNQDWRRALSLSSHHSHHPPSVCE